VDGEGGSTRDYRDYLGNSSGTETDLSGAAGGLVGIIHTAAPFPTLFPANRFESSGAPGKNWVTGEIDQSNNVVTWRLDGTIAAQRTNASIYTSGNIMLGYMDIFSSIASPLSDAYILFNNVRVEDWSSPPMTSPVIFVQPQSQNVLSGTNVTLTSASTGSAPISCQWYFNGNAINDATNNILQLPTIQTTNSGAYAAVFSNAVGTVASSTAQIHVAIRPFQFSSVTNLGTGGIQIIFNGAMGSLYSLQTSENLKDWNLLTTLLVSNNPTGFVDTNAALITGNRYYRLAITQ
jgi:hypothetical protein